MTEESDAPPQERKRFLRRLFGQAEPATSKRPAADPTWRSQSEAVASATKNPDPVEPILPALVPPGGSLDDPIAAVAALAPGSGEAKRSWWTRLKEGLARSSSSIGVGIGDVFTKRKLDAAMLEDLEDVLIRADLGVATATRISEAVGKGRYDRAVTPAEVKAILATEVERVLAPHATPLAVGTAKPFVVLVVGVNGSGKPSRS